MNLTQFIDRRLPEWKRLEELVEEVEGSGLAALGGTAAEFARRYRRAASDLNQAQTFVSGDATVRYLNDLVARCYQVIHARSRMDLRALGRALFLRYPVVFRRHLRQFALAAAVLCLGAALGYVASRWDAEAARGLLLPDMQTIHPGDVEYAQSTGEVALNSARLFWNNTNVTVVAFALGLTLGVGTFWVLFMNGVGLGALAAVFDEAGELGSFLMRVAPHGVLEIPAILIGGAAGFVLAGGLIRARPWPRREELVRSGAESLWLASGSVPLLAVAGLLEAGVAWAPSGALDGGVKWAVASLFGLVFVAYVGLVGRGGSGRDLPDSGKVAPE